MTFHLHIGTLPIFKFEKYVTLPKMVLIGNAKICRLSINQNLEYLYQMQLYQIYFIPFNKIKMVEGWLFMLVPTLFTWQCHHCRNVTWGCHGRDRMVVGFTSTFAFSAYQHWSCEFEPRSREVYSIQHYVIKFVSGLLQVLQFPPPIKLTMI